MSSSLCEGPFGGDDDDDVNTKSLCGLKLTSKTLDPSTFSYLAAVLLVLNPIDTSMTLHYETKAFIFISTRWRGGHESCRT